MKRLVLAVLALLMMGTAQAQNWNPNCATCVGQNLNALPGHGGYVPYQQPAYQPTYQRPMPQPVYQNFQPRYYGPNGGYINPGATQVGQYRRY